MTRSHVVLLPAKRLVIGLMIGIAFCASAKAQTAMFFRSDGLNFPTPGIPFQAEGTARTTQKLPDGNAIAREMRVVLARDADGRFSYTTQSIEPSDDSESHAIIDPVVRRTLSWGTRSKVVMSHRLGTNSHVTVSALPPVPDASSRMTADKKQVKTEDLGKRTIAGIEADGKRTVTTVAAGAIGNANPIVIVHEEWTSSEFQLVLAESDENPLSGDRKFELTSLTRINPLPLIFQSPEGMTIKDITPPALPAPIHYPQTTEMAMNGSAPFPSTAASATGTSHAPPGTGLEMVRQILAFLIALKQAPVKGLPYAATGTIVLDQALADGTKVSNTYDVSYWRDDNGRVRGEFPLILPGPRRNRMVMVFDPIQKIEMTWSEGDTKLNRVMVHRMPIVNTPTVPGIDAAGAQAATENLPWETIAGLSVEGKRATRTIPAGAEGNDHPIAVVSETWTSPDLKLVVRQATDDPRSGKTTLELTKIDRSNPDPALFKAPEGYSVMDMTPTATNTPALPANK
jgi:hypothetical protein